jgi:hypothetical protein
MTALDWRETAGYPLWAADAPGGGILFAVPQDGGWVPALTTSDGYPLWRGEPCATRLSAQQAAEEQAGVNAQPQRKTA